MGESVDIYRTTHILIVAARVRRPLLVISSLLPNISEIEAQLHPASLCYIRLFERHCVFFLFCLGVSRRQRHLLHVLRFLLRNLLPGLFLSRLFLRLILILVLPLLFAFFILFLLQYHSSVNGN